MRLIGKSAIVLSVAGAMALASMTASEARNHRGAFVAGAAGFAAGAAVGAAAANSGYYGYGPGYYNGPSYAYTGDPAYESYAYAPGYDSYAAAPGYGYGYNGETASAPRHYDPGYGYNSNTLSPWQDRKMQGNDY